MGETPPARRVEVTIEVNGAQPQGTEDLRSQAIDTSMVSEPRTTSQDILGERDVIAGVPAVLRQTLVATPKEWSCFPESCW